MKQLILDLALPLPWTLDNFIYGQNAEALFFVKTLVSAPLKDTSLYLWGNFGVGKTHILKAAAALSDEQGRLACYIDCQYSRLPIQLGDYALVIVDNIACLNQGEQITLFNIYNACKEEQRNLLAAGSVPPTFLPLRQDLTTRLGWGLVYEIKTLSDYDKVSALQRRAQHLGFDLSDKLAHYLLQHAARDLPSLMELLNRLDRLALTQHRRITVRLLREVLMLSSDNE